MKRDIVVVGASAGGVQALQSLVGGLPRDYEGSLLVVLHIPSWLPSELAQILSRSGPLPAIQAASNQPLERGHVYVAAPDHHLLVDDHRVVPWKGPMEDRHRPSINALFRSAAVAHRERVTGVVLTGNLDDGATGLWWIKRFGGLAVVQDPAEADFPDMPRNALKYVDIDYVLAVSEIGGLLSELAHGETGSLTSFQAKAARELRKWK